MNKEHQALMAGLAVAHELRELDGLCEGFPGVSWKIVDTCGITWTGRGAVLQTCCRPGT